MAAFLAAQERDLFAARYGYVFATTQSDFTTASSALPALLAAIEAKTASAARAAFLLALQK